MLNWKYLKDEWPNLENRLTSEALLFVVNNQIYYGHAHRNEYFYAYDGYGTSQGLFSTNPLQKYSVFQKVEKWIYFSELNSII